MWEDEDKPSKFYSRLLKFLYENGNMGDYFIRRNELFARCFEKYIAHKLKDFEITNFFLTQRQYNKAIYPNDTEILGLVPSFDKIMTEIRKYAIKERREYEKNS